MIPEGWIETTLGEVAEIAKQSWKPNDSLEKYIGLEHINQNDLSINGFGTSDNIESNKYYFEKGDILFGKLRPYFRKVWKAKFDGICSTDIWVIRAKKNNDQNYLFYFFSNPVFIQKASISSSGTRMPRADWDYLKNTIWQFPPFSEQKEIADILTSLDKKIELLREENKTLEAISQTIFKEWFVNFNFPDENGKPYKSSGGKMIDSELGPIPADWRVGALNELIFDLIPGEWGKDKNDLNFVEEVLCIRGTDLSDIKDGSQIRCPIRFIKKEKAEKIKILKNDLIVEISGGTIGQSTGRIACMELEFLNRCNKTLIASNFCKVLRLKSSIYKYFLYYYWEYFYKKGIFFNFENGTTGIQNLNLKAFLDNEIILPHNKQIIFFHDSICMNIIKIQKINSQIQYLSTLRDKLLPKLMSCNIRVIHKIK